MFKTRLLSGIVLVVLALVLIITGGSWNCRISCSHPVLLQLKIHRNSGCDDVRDRFFGCIDVYLCVFLSKISYRADACSFFWSVLCGSHAVLHLSDQNALSRNLHGVADLSLFLGL